MQDFCKFKNTSAGLSCQEPETGSCVCFAFQKDNIPIEQNWPGNKGIVEVCYPIAFDRSACVCCVLLSSAEYVLS